MSEETQHQRKTRAELTQEQHERNIERLAQANRRLSAELDAARAQAKQSDRRLRHCQLQLVALKYKSLYTPENLKQGIVASLLDENEKLRKERDDLARQLVDKDLQSLRGKP